MPGRRAIEGPAALSAIRIGLALILIVIATCLAGCSSDVGESGATWRMRVFVDPVHGCHYVGRYKYGLTPRMDADGRQVCDTDFQRGEYRP